jgi:hypothetical protein
VKKYFYIDGREVLCNDTVLVRPNRRAWVQFLLEPGSPLAEAYSSPLGGFVLRFEDGDHQLWHNADEDIQLVRRARPTSKEAQA